MKQRALKGPGHQGLSARHGSANAPCSISSAPHAARRTSNFNFCSALGLSDRSILGFITQPAPDGPSSASSPGRPIAEPGCEGHAEGRPSHPRKMSIQLPVFEVLDKYPV